MLKDGDEELFVELKQARVLLGELPHAIDELVQTQTSAISTIATQQRSLREEFTCRKMGARCESWWFLSPWPQRVENLCPVEKRKRTR